MLSFSTNGILNIKPTAVDEGAGFSACLDNNLKNVSSTKSNEKSKFSELDLLNGENEKRSTFDRDEMMTTLLSNFSKKMIYSSIEFFFKKYFPDLKTVIFWENVPSVEILFSRSLNDYYELNNISGQHIFKESENLKKNSQIIDNNKKYNKEDDQKEKEMKNSSFIKGKKNNPQADYNENYTNICDKTKENKADNIKHKVNQSVFPKSHIGLMNLIFLDKLVDEIFLIDKNHNNAFFSLKKDGPYLNLNEDESSIIFSIKNISKNEIFGVVQLIKSKKSHFSDEEKKVCEWFKGKLELLLKIILSDTEKLHPSVIEIIDLMRTDQLLTLSCQKIAQILDARKCEIWMHDKREIDEGVLVRFSENKVKFDINESGIVGKAFKEKCDINCVSNVSHPNFNIETDGNSSAATGGDEPVLVHFFELTNGEFKPKSLDELMNYSEMPLFNESVNENESKQNESNKNELNKSNKNEPVNENEPNEQIKNEPNINESNEIGPNDNESNGYESNGNESTNNSSFDNEEFTNLFDNSVRGNINEIKINADCNTDNSSSVISANDENEFKDSGKERLTNDNKAIFDNVAKETKENYVIENTHKVNDKINGTDYSSERKYSGFNFFQTNFNTTKRRSSIVNSINHNTCNLKGNIRNNNSVTIIDNNININPNISSGNNNSNCNSNDNNNNGDNEIKMDQINNEINPNNLRVYKSKSFDRHYSNFRNILKNFSFDIDFNERINRKRNLNSTATSNNPKESTSKNDNNVYCGQSTNNNSYRGQCRHHDSGDYNITFDDVSLAIVLRGNSSNKKQRVFLEEDLQNLKEIMKLIVVLFKNSERFTRIDDEMQKKRIEKEGLTALLDVAEELSCQLDANSLIETIIEKGRLLTNADRCSLFLVNESRDRLITSFHSGLSNCIDIPIDCGIVGKTVIENRPFNIADAYQSEYFDNSTDKKTGYRTRQLLSVPIRNNRGEVIGVTEMVNRNDDKPFTKWDVDIIQIFNIFCGISLENAKLFEKSIFMAAQLRSFMNTSFSLSQTESIHRILTDIMQNARRSINAENASLFLVDEVEKCLKTFIIDGGNVPPKISLRTGIAAECAINKVDIIVNDCYNDPRFNRSVDAASSSGFRTRSVLAVPLIRTDDEGTLLGVAEMINKKEGSFTNDDLNMMRSFAAFATIALENSRLKDIEKYGNVESEITKWINEEERPVHDRIPTKLEFATIEEKEKILSINCFAKELKGIGHVKTIYFIFNRFHILETFGISNEMLFKFIFDLRNSYNDVPYHNWTHACDVLQYVSYELHIGELDCVFTKFELFALLTAAICHDANHNGYNNIYNIKSETPLGILFKGQSVMETHHVTITINILEKDETNLFINLNTLENKKMWNMIIKLILATDMAVHFSLVQSTNLLLDNGEFSLEEKEEHRQIAMNLLLKVADISNVSRPFEIADRWCSILQEEFFRQGDMEKENGIGLSSPLNDRENVDTPKSQIGFYNFICLPLYQVTARVFKKLGVNVDRVKENLAVWMSMVKQQPQKE